MEPTSGYAKLGDQQIAYQVVGDGPIDLVFTAGFATSADVAWEEPAVRLIFQQMARFARVILFDQRGTGASDPISIDALPPWESFADEIEAVMDAVDSPRAAIFAGGPAGPGAMLFAATRPERVTALILMHAAVRYLEDEDYPVGQSLEQIAEGQARFGAKWGTGEAFDLMFPSRAGDERLRAWWAKLERSITSPAALAKHQAAILHADARALLPSIAVPTLVLHKADNRFVPIGWSEYIADKIANARLVTLPGSDMMPFFESTDELLDLIEEFLTGARPQPRADRQLATVLFTDIVDSTGRAAAMGDRRWRETIDLHDSLAADHISAHGGKLVKTTGDGVLATFDGPGRAIRGAMALQSELDRAGIAIRSGVHTGEIEVRRDDVAGVAVHLAARIMGLADADEILVSGTVRDLVIGSDIVFEDRGEHPLKGFDGQWRLFAVADGSRTDGD